MKVNDPNLSGALSGGLGKTGVERTHQTDAVERGGIGKGAGARGVAGDLVELSDLGSRLRALSANSPERVARMEQLRADVQTGRYRVDAGEVSRSLIEDALKSLP